MLNFKEAAKSEQGQKVLMAYARISDANGRKETLEAVIREMGVYKVIVKLKIDIRL